MAVIERIEILMVDLQPKVKRAPAANGSVKPLPARPGAASEAA